MFCDGDEEKKGIVAYVTSPRTQVYARNLTTVEKFNMNINFVYNYIKHENIFFDSIIAASTSQNDIVTEVFFPTLRCSTEGRRVD